MSNLVDYAKRELELAGLLSAESDYNGMLGEAALQLIETFAAQGHSGQSASIVTYIFNRLARYEPLTALTGADDEWQSNDYVAEPKFQNTRCSHVFKNSDGTAYDMHGHDGKRIDTGITFPYKPKRA